MVTEDFIYQQRKWKSIIRFVWETEYFFCFISMIVKIKKRKKKLKVTQRKSIQIEAIQVEVLLSEFVFNWRRSSIFNFMIKDLLPKFLFHQFSLLTDLCLQVQFIHWLMRAAFLLAWRKQEPIFFTVKWIFYSQFWSCCLLVKKLFLDIW